MKKPNIYLIKWHDAQSEDGWLHFNKRNNRISPMIIQTIGFLINENKVTIKIASSWGQNKDKTNPQYNGIMVIPKKSILKKKKIL